MTSVFPELVAVDNRQEPVDVAVIMPAYNAARFVADAIRSVLEQTLSNLQLVIVDDGSTDDTLERMNSVRDDRVEVLTTSNRGPSHARNLAIAAARPSRYLAFIDADDLWDTGKLADQVAFLDINPQVIAVGCFMRYVSSKGRILGMTGQIITAAELAAIGRGELFPFRTSSLLVRRSALAQVGGFDEMLGRHGSEDLDLYARLARLGSLACIPCALGSYRMHPDSFMARRRQEVNEAARFVRLRLQARDRGLDLTWETFRQDHPVSWWEFRQDLVERAYRSAALSYGESRYALAFAYGALAVLMAPYYSLRRVHRQRWVRAAREVVRDAQPVDCQGRSSR